MELCSSLSLSVCLCVSFFVRVTSRKTLTNSLYEPNKPNGWEVSLASLTLSIRLIERKRGRECLIMLLPLICPITLIISIYCHWRVNQREGYVLEIDPNNHDPHSFAQEACPSSR